MHSEFRISLCPSHGWNLNGSESYDTKNLSTDTLTILDNNSTVLVHMETLRRAALYVQKDSFAAKQLLLKLVARANDTNSAAVLGLFDEGYFAATLNQLHWIKKDFDNPAQSLDAYALVKEAIRRHNDDAQMNFAAALITLEDPPGVRQGHAKAALVGAHSDPLLARNLTARFMGPQSETMADMISRTSSSKVARQ